MKCSTLLLVCEILWTVASQHFTERIRASDEPQLVSYRVLEGVTEPFESQGGSSIPAWKIMKDSADQKAAKHLIQQALHEYGQLLKNPLLFGAVPMEDRYDVFISMSKLLKTMGFYQKAEVLLYEAMSYSKKPYEAHFQLSLLYLEKEDMHRAKMHLKNCLYYQESDVSILVYLSTILLAEGKHHEAKFYLTRILSNLDAKLHKLSSILLGVPHTISEKGALANEAPPSIDHTNFLYAVEDLMFRVFHGEYALSPLGATEAFSFFTNLLSWLSDGEMMGRFIFDLGQALYEKGRPEVGMIMMTRGFATADAPAEGRVSLTVTELRLALEYPVIPRSVAHILEAYLNITSYLATTQTTYTSIDLENIMDVYWPLPLLHFSGLPVAPILQELVQRFHAPDTLLQYNEATMHWLTHGAAKKKCFDNSSALAAIAKKAKAFAKKPTAQEDGDSRISIGILAGHLNSHPVGHTLLLRILRLNREKFRLTLIALPLAPDDITKRIAAQCDQIVNLPVSTSAAWSLLQSLRLDVLMMPDWFPFPDSQGLFLMTRRVAPVQVCVFVRGSSCATTEIDYYLLSNDMAASFVQEMDEPTIPSWREQWSEQMVMLEWPMLTPSVVAETLRLVSVTTAASGGSKKRPSLSVAPGEDRFNILPFLPLETEGQIFFDNQPVALLPLYPGYLHPLMDEMIFRILRSVSNLQIIIALPAAFSAQSQGQQQPRDESSDELRDVSIEWAKRLVRRYWSRVGSALHNRIRLLPYPLSDMRLLQLMRQVDMMFDSFPIGAPLQTLALALSVGTPIITMDCGVQLSTPKDELFDIKHHFAAHPAHHSNPMYKHIIDRPDSDIPWRRTISPLPAYYRRIGVGEQLIANSTVNYAAIAERIVTDKEVAYELRVRILDATDAGVEKPKSKFSKTADVSFDDGSHRDMERFLESTGKEWAEARERRRQTC